MIAVHSVSHVKARFAEMINEVHETRNPLIVTQNGNSSVVIIDHATFQQTQDALAMMRLIAMGEADVAAGRTIPHEEVFSSLKQRLKERIAAEKPVTRKKRA